MQNLRQNIFEIARSISDRAYGYFKLLGIESREPQNVFDATELQIPMFVQNLDFKGVDIRGARKAAELQISRLSPIAPDEIYWDVQEDGDGQYLAIIRRKSAARLREDGSFTGDILNLKTKEDLTFGFVDEVASQNKMKKFWLGLGWVVVTYLLLLQALSAWHSRFQDQAIILSSQISEVSRNVEQLKIATLQTQIEIDLLERQLQQDSLVQPIKHLTTISKILKENEWVDNYGQNGYLHKFSAFVENENQFLAQLRPLLPHSVVRLSGSSRDPVSGLSRIVVNIQPLSQEVDK